MQVLLEFMWDWAQYAGMVAVTLFWLWCSGKLTHWIMNKISETKLEITPYVFWMLASLFVGFIITAWRAL